MEAEVFEYQQDMVLKIYTGTATVNHLTILSDLYRSIDRTLVPYDLPNIYSITKEYDHVVLIERKLVGQPMSAILNNLNDKELDTAMQTYVTAVHALANIKPPNNLGRLKLFDPAQLSLSSNGDWNRFLLNYLNHKRAHLSPYLERDVNGFTEKSNRLDTLLKSPYNGDYTLIHGDFCPSNLLIDAQNNASALIDFGLLTMYGDPLFDLATSWVFFDMYDELKAAIRDRLLDILLDMIGSDKRGMLYRYVLIYSILSANSYSTDCTDGHYRWCVANLNNPHYWKRIS